MAMDAKTPVVNKLSETIHSLLGLKTHLTSTWVTSVCDIVNNLQPHVSTTDLESSNIRDKMGDPNTDISKIKDELAALTTRISHLNIERRHLLNEFLDLKGNIRVFCRIRPITVGEKFGRFRPVIALDSSNVVLKFSDQKSKHYTFDKVFHPESSQDEVFSEIEPVIKSVLDGYNACIFAYGQTGTGKTFTMEGTQELPGVVPRAIEALFKQATDSNHTFLISFSMLEIYMGNLRDLLVARPTKATDPLPPCLAVQTDPKGGVEIENLVAINVNDYNQVLKLYKLGCQFRSTASTGSNSTSSRSHCMIRISISCSNAPERRRETNKIWLVDLGGSERVLKTRASGRRLEEGKAINLSLSALGDVINALQRKKSHVPYRNSKLTQVLKDSLGQDSKTLMLVHVSPKEEDLCETVCSLSFATRARSIHLGSEDPAGERYHKEALMMSLQQKMKQIEEERCIVRGEMQRLNEKLEGLTGIAPPSTKELPSSNLSIDTPNSNHEIVKKTRDLRKLPSSQLPRFMRPTVASRTKLENENQLSENRGLNGPRRRRRPPSHRAESIALPLKAGSEYNSECSISRASCMVTLNVKHFVDNETEYSQDMTESDIKTVMFSESEKQSRSSALSKAQYQKRKIDNGNATCTGFSKVENWLHSHGTEHIKGNNYRTKHVLAKRTPTNRIHHGRRESQEVLDEMPIKDSIIHDETTENSLVFSDDTVNKVSRTSSNPLSGITDDEKKMEDFEDHPRGSLIEDDECHTPSLHDSRLQEINSKNQFDAITVTQEVERQEQFSEISELKALQCSPRHSDLDRTILDPKKDIVASLTFEEESHLEDRNVYGIDNFFQSSTEGTRSHLWKLKCQRALFEDREGKKDLTLPNLSSQQTQNSDTMGKFSSRIGNSQSGIRS